MLENLNHSIQFYKLGMLSPNGISLPFDEKANGYVRSEGVVAILLSSRSVLCIKNCDNAVNFDSHFEFSMGINL